MKSAPTLPEKLPNRFKVQLGGFRRLKWRERLKLAFGWNLAANIELLVDKRTGQVWHHIDIFVTAETTLEGQKQQEEAKEKQEGGKA